MVIVTESGAQYRIFNGVCKKFDNTGAMVDVFKVWEMKAVEPGVTEWEELHESNTPVQVGMNMYIAGKDNWWISTPVVEMHEWLGD